VHPQTGDVTLGCPGFNDKNRYDRQTPCDQDFLRKFARDNRRPTITEWFNREVPRCLRALKLFDRKELFIGDAATCCSRPGALRALRRNVVSTSITIRSIPRPWICGTTLPVAPVLQDRLADSCQPSPGFSFWWWPHAWSRATSMHAPSSMPLVDGLVKALGRGVMKVLILDRGLLDAQPSAAQIRTPHRHRHPAEDQHGRLPGRDGPDAPARFPLGTVRAATATPPAPPDRPKDPVIAQRERKRSETCKRPSSIPAPPLPRANPCWASSAASPVGRLSRAVKRRSSTARSTPRRGPRLGAGDHRAS